MQTNNKLREALEYVRGMVGLFRKEERISYDEWQGCDDMISAALAEPVKNCEVLETEELIRQHNSFCGNSKNSYKCINASASECRRCLAKFMQMPYEEGGAK